MDPTRVVDVHAHLMVREIQALVQGHRGLAAVRALAARRNGAVSEEVNQKMFAGRVVQLTNLGRRLADMDATGVDVQLLSVFPGQFAYFAEPDLALDHLPVRRPGSCGARCPSSRGASPDSGWCPCSIRSCASRPSTTRWPRGCWEWRSRPTPPGPKAARSNSVIRPWRPFWARAAETGAVIFLHPIACTLDERLDRFYLANTVGQPVENAVALSHLIFAGVLDRHPGLRVIAAHGGGYLPTYLGRSDHAWQVRPDAHGCVEPPSSYLRRLWFDSLVHSPDALRALVAVVGADRVLLGSDYPVRHG